MEQNDQAQDEIDHDAIDEAVHLFQSTIGFVLLSNPGDEHEAIGIVLTALQHTIAEFLVDVGDGFTKGKEDEAFEAGLQLLDRSIRGMVTDLRQQRQLEKLEGLAAQ